MLGDILKNRTVALVGLTLLAAAPLVAWAGQPVVYEQFGQPGQAAASPESGGAAAARVNGSVGGYEGWWNATPASGDTSGLPQEAVAVNTETGKVVDAFNRSINDAGRPTQLTDVNYNVTADPAWPANSVVIIDTATNRVIADFRVDAQGEPVR